MSVGTTPGTFVWLEPAFGHEFPPAEGAAYMDQQGQMFMPDTLLARTGQPIHFRSTEDVLHNVRVIWSDKTPIFNVASTPYVGTADEHGRFTFEPVVPGTYTIGGFADATPIQKTVEITGSRVDVSLR